MNELNNFYSKVASTPITPPIKDTIEINANPLINRDAFRQKIPYIDQIPDYELLSLIKSSLDIIIMEINNGDTEYINAVTNHKFLDAFTKVMSMIPIDYDKKRCCNKIAYDYMTLEDSDEFTKVKLLNLSLIVNRDVVQRLKTLNLNEKSSANIALSRFSSAKEIVNVKRLNFTICNMDEEVMTEQMIIWIYEKLFTRISDLFEGSMFEWYSAAEEEVLGESFMNIYSIVSLAVLTILNNMPIQDITKVIVSYANNWKFKNKPPVRFSLKTLSGDFSRINSVVESLENTSIYVP